jgi:putative Mg2+ transporter-C (MgtC) family protein
MLTNTDLILRLLLAAGLGAAIGFERERAHKVAGLRTHALVSLGAAMFSLITLYLYEAFPSVNGVSGFDYHLIANVIVGIGFIGAGTIMRHGSRIVGTTTASTLWLVAGVGMAAGLGFYMPALVGAAIGYLVLTLLWQVQTKIIAKVPYNSNDIADKEESDAENTK